MKALLFGETELAEMIIIMENPVSMKRVCRHIKNFIQDTCDKHACDIVHKGNVQKFTYNSDLWLALKNTRRTTLVKSSPTDGVWGIQAYATEPQRNERRHGMA